MGASTDAETSPRFPSWLIKPDVQFSRIRLSDGIHHRLTNAHQPPNIGQLRQNLCIGLAIGQLLQHLPAADTQQIAHWVAGLINTCVLTQRRPLIAQTDAVARELVLAADQRPPRALPGVRDKVLAPFARPIGLRVRQVQPALPFQLPPHRLPVLRRRLHHHLAHRHDASRHARGFSWSLVARRAMETGFWPEQLLCRPVSATIMIDGRARLLSRIADHETHGAALPLLPHQRKL